MTNEDFMRLAIKEAEKSIKYGDVPVGAIVVKNKKVIAKGYNKRNKTNNTLMHAELIAIGKACKRLKDWRLEGCDIYVTLEPCPMCAGAIAQARFDNLYYGAKSDKGGSAGSVIDLINTMSASHKINVVCGICADESSKPLKDFFLALRQGKIRKKEWKK